MLIKSLHVASTQKYEPYVALQFSCFFAFESVLTFYLEPLDVANSAVGTWRREYRRNFARGVNNPFTSTGSSRAHVMLTRLHSNEFEKPSAPRKLRELP